MKSKDKKFMPPSIEQRLAAIGNIEEIKDKMLRASLLECDSFYKPIPEPGILIYY